MGMLLNVAEVLWHFAYCKTILSTTIFEICGVTTS